MAPDATIVGIRQGVGSQGSLSQVSAAVTLFDRFDVVNNSWTFSGFFFDDFDNLFFRTVHDELTDAVQNGRDGLGTVVVFAAGNDAAAGQDVNYHAFQNSPMTIAVGGMTGSGAPFVQSTPGASVLLVAPATQILTTDRVGAAGGSGGIRLSSTAPRLPRQWYRRRPG